MDGNVWEDWNAMCKSQKIHLVRLSSSLCLGVIGADEFRVCLSPALVCKTFSRKKFKLALGCDVAYCIPTRNQCSIGLPAGFCMPLLDASNMTDEVRELVEDQSLKGALTTREWELFIPQALLKVEFEQRGLGPNTILKRSLKRRMKVTRLKKWTTSCPSTFNHCCLNGMIPSLSLTQQSSRVMSLKSYKTRGALQSSAGAG